MTTNGPEPGSASHTQVDEVILLEACLELAEGLQARQHPWHSHVLPPGCVRNPFPQHAIVIEDDQDRRVYAAASSGFPDIGKDLVQMLHGTHILDRQRTTAVTGGGIQSRLLDRVRKVDASGRPWHHHMCFPACVFNPEPGRWTIAVESGQSSWSESWDEDPVDVLRELEVMFFAS